MLREKPAIRSSVILGWRTGNWMRSSTGTKPSTTKTVSFMTVPGHVQKPLKQCEENYIFHSAQCTFAARCRNENIDHFMKYLHIVANTDWSVSRPLHNACAMWIAAVPLPPYASSASTIDKCHQHRLRPMEHGLRARIQYLPLFREVLRTAAILSLILK
jgi:hypothetical protein